VWENTSTGERVIWLMNGTTRASTAMTTPVATAWRIVGAADFNADTKPDLVFENPSTKARAVWYMNGTTKSGSANFAAPET
jgi:hypothetical protein